MTTALVLQYLVAGLTYGTIYAVVGDLFAWLSIAGLLAEILVSVVAKRQMASAARQPGLPMGA